MKSEQERLKKRLTDPALLDRISKGDLLYKEKKYDEAIEVYKSLLNDIDNSYEFDLCETYRKLGNCYYDTKKQDEARFNYEKTLNYCTTNGSIYGMLAYLYYYVDNDIAIKYYSKTLEINSKDEPALSSICLTILKSHKYSQKLIKDTFEKIMHDAKIAIMNGQKAYEHTHRDLKNKKKLRVAYLSSDFHCHAMMQFILPLLEAHHLDKFDFILYSTGKKSDSTTGRIKNIGIEFRDCRDLDNKQLARVIYEDEVDILVDLGGLTHCRSFALFYKPAPIQMQYLGFVNTMGMKDIDYIFADEFTIPRDMAKYYTEKPLYLGTCMNRFFFDTNNKAIPQANELPYHKNGYITFGSYNCPSKINDYTISLWSRLLKHVENSKLLIYRTQLTEDMIRRFKNKFLQNGITEDRLIFNNKPCEISHFYSYHMSDIALDPTPFNGLTITLELISMGVPVLTLAGDSMQSRGCARVNKSLGLDNLIASTEDEYIQKAKILASDIAWLDNFRKTSRENLLNSLLIQDKEGFATAVENAYERAWQEYCKSL